MSACPAWKGHSVPVRDYPSPDLWCLLQCELAAKERAGHNYTNHRYLAAIEAEWSQRNVCSNCFEVMGDDNPPVADLMERIRELEDENEVLREQTERPRVRIGFGT